VAAELLHPPFAPTGTDNSVNAWLASDPTQDPTSAVADSVFRKDWVSENFTGGRLKAGGNVAGDQDSYSFGCAMLFIYYLKDQLDFSMPGIVQNGPTLAGAYGAATGGRTGGFWAFKSLLDQHFPIGVKVSTDDPFPLSTNALATRVGPAAAASGNATAALITNVDGRVFYTWWQLGEGGKAFGEVGPGLQTDATPAAALVGPGHDYLFVLAKDMDGNLQLNQGQLGRPFVGWQPVGFHENPPTTIFHVVAFQANTGDLWIVGPAGQRRHRARHDGQHQPGHATGRRMSR
jgi:hypothetical protein